jgi:hypothetical protein
MIGTLFTVGILMNVAMQANEATVASPTEDLVGTAAVVVNHGHVDERSTWMATAMSELEKERNHGEQMLAQVRTQAAMEDSPSKEVKMALADGIATKLEQLKTTEAGKKFLMQVNKEAVQKPQWVRMIARQAARNMLLDVITATKKQVLLDTKKTVLAPRQDPWQSKPSPQLKAKVAHAALSTDAKAKLEELAKGDDAKAVGVATKKETTKMLPKEVSQVSSILNSKPDATHEKLAVAAQQINHSAKNDDTKVKLPMALEVVHKLTQLAQTPEGSNYIRSVKSHLTGHESPKEIDDVTYKVAHTMLKQLVGNVKDDLLVDPNKK